MIKNRNSIKEPFWAIQYHLYEHPLYQYCRRDEKDLNVLIIGFGKYGQTFLDACLQNGQMSGKTLNVAVFFRDTAEKEYYCSRRPELAEFFSLNGSQSEDKDVYGYITFEKAELVYSDNCVNEDKINRIMLRYNKDLPLHYAFINLGEDALNRAVATLCKKISDRIERSFFVSHICENKRLSESDDKDDDVFPLYINEDCRYSGFYNEVERMAFNTHLVWEKNLNGDYKKIRAEYRKPYNHDSCVSSVFVHEI